MRRQARSGRTQLQPAQGLVEAVLAVAILIPVAIGFVGLLRLERAQAGADALAYEAARSAVLANSASEAVDLGSKRAQALAPAYGLVDGTLEVSVEVSNFGRGEPVQALVTYAARDDPERRSAWGGCLAIKACRPGRCAS
jgi:hypothetical protein